jgi:hypothetical protein
LIYRFRRVSGGYYRLELSAGGDGLMDGNDIGSSFRKDLRYYFVSNLVNFSLNYLEWMMGILVVDLTDYLIDL